MPSWKKNPFEIFGLTPEIVNRLDDKSMFSLIKSLFRTLHKVYHPDHSIGKSPQSVAEDTAHAVELNLAFEELNLEKNAASFKLHQKSYAAKRSRGLSKKISGLENEIQAAMDYQAVLGEGFMRYLLRGLPWNDLKDQPSCHRIVPPANIKLGLNDVAINQNIRSDSWSLGSNYKEIIFDQNGAMFYRPVGRSKPFAVNYIHLLGVIETNQIDLLPLLHRVPPREGFFKSPALDSRYGIDGAPHHVLNTMSAEKFQKYCLPLIKPDLLERAYLFSIHRPIYEEDASISLEGVLVKISTYETPGNEDPPSTHI